MIGREQEEVTRGWQEDKKETGFGRGVGKRTQQRPKGRDQRRQMQSESILCTGWVPPESSGSTTQTGQRDEAQQLEMYPVWLQDP